MWLFLRWIRLRTGKASFGFPFKENWVYKYVCHLRASGAPATKAKAFVEAVLYTGAVVEISGVEEVSRSSRIHGAAHLIALKKRPTKKARGLKVAEVLCLENGTKLGGSLCDRYACSFFAFCVHTRTRGKEASTITDPLTLDLSPDGTQAFVETAMSIHKTANKGTTRTPLPVVGHAVGISGVNWAAEMLSLRRELGLSDEDGLLTVPRGDGCGFTTKPLSNSEMSIWLQELLVAGGFSSESIEDVTTHSLRATALSWCAKHGVREGTRRMLAYQAKPKDYMMLEYSRDAMAGPMAALGQVLDDITTGKFQPDSTRSGYKKACPGPRSTPAVEEATAKGPVEVPEGPAPATPLVASPAEDEPLPVRGYLEEISMETFA